MSPERLSFRRGVRPPAPSARGLVALFLVTVAAFALTRSWWSSRAADGVLVEVRGDVPDPGMVLASPPTAGAALRAAGAQPDGLRGVPVEPLRDGAALVVTDGTVRLAEASDPVLVALPIDLNRATPEQLAAIPGVNRRTAEAVVEDRALHGPFLVVSDLVRVSGVGEGTLERLRPFVSIEEVPLVDVNRAPAGELESLPGIGPVLAARIVVDREDRGPFASVDDLARVRGVSASTVAGLRARAEARP